MLEFLQSEPIAERRHWVIVLVDSTDGVTGKTGQTGQVYLSKNGGTPALSTNSIVEVDSTNMPGHYYVILTAGELDTLGFISLVKKTASTLAFHDRAIISYNNPYNSAGGFSGGGTTNSGGVSKAQVDDLLKKWRKILQEELAKLEFPELPQIPDYENYFGSMLEGLEVMKLKETDLTPVLEAIGSLPAPYDHTKEFSELTKNLGEFGKSKAMDVTGFDKATKEFIAKMELATKDINGSLDEVAAIKSGFEELQKQMEEFKTTLAEQGDMDKRFDAMGQATNNKSIEALTKKITELAVQITNLRYDKKLEALKQ